MYVIILYAWCALIGWNNDAIVCLQSDSLVSNTQASPQKQGCSESAVLQLGKINESDFSLVGGPFDRNTISCFRVVNISAKVYILGM